MEPMCGFASSPSDGTTDPASEAARPPGVTYRAIGPDEQVTTSNGEDDEGPSRGTLRDVADSLGISSAVALRALRGLDDIKPQMRERVRETAERPHYPLEELVEETDQRGVVAVLVNTMRNTWISDLVRAIRIELSATGDRKSTRLNSSHVAISYA